MAKAKDDDDGHWVAIGPVAAGVFAMVWRREIVLDADNENRPEKGRALLPGQVREETPKEGSKAQTAPCNGRQPKPANGV